MVQYTVIVNSNNLFIQLNLKLNNVLFPYFSTNSNKFNIVLGIAFNEYYFIETIYL